MTNKYIAKQLSDISCPSIEMPIYRGCLKHVLVAQPQSKRERFISFVESSCGVLSGNRILVSGVGVSLSLVIFFFGGSSGEQEFSISQAQAQDTIEEMQLSSQAISQSERRELEAQLQMNMQQLMEQAKNARMRVVYDVDPRLPMRVVHHEDNQVYMISFISDDSGKFKVNRGAQMSRLLADKIATMAAQHKVLQYVTNEGSVVIVLMNEASQPQSGIVLAGN